MNAAILVPPANAVDPVVELPDLRVYPAGPQRKQAFFELLVPVIEAENTRIAAQRAWLKQLQASGGASSRDEQALLATLCDDYGLECNDDAAIDKLLTRVNVVPLSMAVIQAVEESGWGTSRFARQGNNLFGLRCFSDGCGLTQAGSGRGYQTFDSVQQAVRTYLHNLNTHDAYAELRALRAQLERESREVTAEALIGALKDYAVRDDYQDVLLSLLRTNDRLIARHRSDDTV
ncbi:Bax protein [Modicisalibacter muralis]|uniref:Bax protein n=1 Tax=Modicisalibacter muralis TaxID=119000 RepID=A0A1G9PYD7_9GAMM|nr:protein bax [Halomonas muralis]SDM03501.1 Bax protein [Halomonas muralis]